MPENSVSNSLLRKHLQIANCDYFQGGSVSPYISTSYYTILLVITTLNYPDCSGLEGCCLCFRECLFDVVCDGGTIINDANKEPAQKHPEYYSLRYRHIGV